MKIYFLKDTIEDKISKIFFYQFLNEVKKIFEIKIISIFDNHDFSKNSKNIYILWSSTLNSKYKDFLSSEFKKYNCKFLIIEHSVFFRNKRIRVGINGFDYNNMHAQNNNINTRLNNDFISTKTLSKNTIIFIQRINSYLHSSNQLEWIEKKIIENKIFENIYLKPHPIHLSNLDFKKILLLFCKRNNIKILDSTKPFLNNNSTVINYNSSPLIKAAYHKLNFIGYENHYLYKINHLNNIDLQKKLLEFELDITKINYEKLFDSLF